MAQTVKNPPAMQDIWVQSLGWEDSWEEGKPTPLCLSRCSVSSLLCVRLSLSPRSVLGPLVSLSQLLLGLVKASLAFCPLAALTGKSISKQSPGSTLGPGSSPSARLPQPLGHPLAAGKVSNASPTSSHGDALVNLTRAFFLFIRFLITYYV